MKYFYCPTCKKQVTDVYLDNLTGISVSQFSRRCRTCDTPVIELSDEEIKIEEPAIQHKAVPKAEDKRKGLYYGTVSIAVALAGFVAPSPINIFLGIAAIVLGRQAIISGASRIGKIGAVFGFIDFVFFLVSVTVGISSFARIF